ncbi:hypothetical protein BDY21DRAFT_348818 [Lineolata rhizophorae]|uniref:N-acetyltransferase domain-containing protein n=1 Tax=Lineolata rhizophorae TaxID=578093 RepID=A0A6A6NVT7_9PEZI|nr:hypothetical protein BDY21DRAFT_348818 [Lineolata rhizophorae]
MDDASGQPEPKVEKYNGAEITSEMLQDAARLFSENYGIWGPRGPKPGSRVSMSAAKLRRECLPEKHEHRCGYSRIVVDGQLVANAFACYWDCAAGRICWVTQLVVRPEFRSRRFATRLLGAFLEEQVWAYGIMSSHAHACMAAVNAFGRKVDSVRLSDIRDHAELILAASPIGYLKSARLHGSLFNAGVVDGSVSSADTHFFVDHAEPRQALEGVKGRLAPLEWPFGELMECHEFVVIVKPQ